MSLNKMFCVLGVGVAMLAACDRNLPAGADEAAVRQAAAAPTAPAQASAPVETSDPSVATPAAQTAVTGAVKAAIAMHAQASMPAIDCGFAAEAGVAESKAEIRTMALADGIDTATFDQVYAAAERAARVKWQSASAAQRASACEEWKAVGQQ